MNLMAGGGRQLITASGAYTSIPETYLDANNDVTGMAAGERIVHAISAPTAAYQGVSVDIVCRWQGTTSGVELWGPAVANARYASGTASFTWVPEAEQVVTFIYTGTDPANPLRSLDCREANADPALTFDPTFVDSVKRYSVIRFMDWMSTNDNKAVTWTTRNRPGKGLIKAKDGVALEYMIQLANLTGVNPWFNVPWNADADYVQRMATLIRDTLDPKLTVHVEVSNEVWNYKFDQTQQAQTEGAAAGLGGAEARPLTAVSRYAQKTSEVMTVWSGVFAGQTNRLVRIAATQNSSYAIGVILKFPGALANIDAIAVAPYFGGAIPAGGLATQALIDDQLDVQLPAKMNMRPARIGCHCPWQRNSPR